MPLCYNSNNKEKAVLPRGSTYKLRKNIYMDQNIRIFPSYIMTGKNLEIEKSKSSMISEDIQELMRYCKDKEQVQQE